MSNETMKPQGETKPQQPNPQRAQGQVSRGEFDAFRDETQRSLGQISDVLSQISSRLMGHESLDPDRPLSAFPMNSAKRTAQIIAAHQRELTEKGRELASGPKHWWGRVKHHNETPDQAAKLDAIRVPVGAENKMYAKAKFQDFHGITGFTEQGVSILLEPMTDEEVTALQLA